MAGHVAAGAADGFGPDKVVTVLTISAPDEDLESLGEIFRHSKWRLCSAPSLREGVAALREQRTPVVLCERDLPDGTWRVLFREIETFEDPPLLIVTSRQADDSLWAEVLNMGGYDVLQKPYEPTEVVRVISMAWLQWRLRRRPATVQPTELRASA